LFRFETEKKKKKEEEEETLSGSERINGEHSQEENE
jgi:hypothetical protein